MNRAYIERIADYYSYHSHQNTTNAREYIQKDGEFIREYPRLGNVVRNAYDEAARSNNVPWGISDYHPHTREIQGVGCRVLFAEDHTHEACKNYFWRRQIGAHALWDVAGH